MKRLFSMLFPIVLAMLMLSVSPVAAFYGDIATDYPSVTLGISGQGTNHSSSLTALFPVKRLNGWSGFYVNRQDADEKIVAETYNGHLQGGFKVGTVGIEAYIDATRDKLRAIDLSLAAGYFVRPAVITYEDIKFSFGAGNFTENRNLDDDIGRAAADGETSFGWLAFVSGQRGNISGVLRYKPEIQFNHYMLEGSLSFSKDLDEHLALGASLLTIYDTNSATDKDLHTSYLVTVTFTPGE